MGRPGKNFWDNDAAAAAALFAVCILFCSPFIWPFYDIPFEESFLQFSSYVEHNVMFWLRDGRIPLWSYHFGGGYPFFKHPENIVFSPLFYLLVLPFGTAAGLKLFLLSSYAAGAAGFYLLARRAFNFPLPAALLAALFFLLNSFVPYQINTGNINDQGWLYLPLVLYLLLRSEKDRRFVLYTAGLICVLLLNGFSLYIVPMALFLFLYCLGSDVEARGKRGRAPFLMTAHLFAAFLIAGMLAAVKILPLMELLGENARPISDYHSAGKKAMTVWKFGRAIADRGPFAVGYEEFNDGENGLEMSCVMYFGLIPCVFFMWSSFFCFRKVRKHLGIGFLFIILSMAENSPVDLFYLLWHLPLFHSMHVAARYFAFPFIFLFPLVACAFMASSRFSKWPRRARGVVYALALVAVGDMFVSNTKYYADIGRLLENVPPGAAEAPFFQVEMIELDDHGAVSRRDKPWDGYREDTIRRGLQYFLLRQNIGLTNWNGNIDLPEMTVPKYFALASGGDFWRDFRRDPTSENGVSRNNDYRGEVLYASHKTENKVRQVYWHADRIEIEVRQTRPDRLIVNQNYDPDWKASPGVVYEHKGRLMVALEKAKSGKVVLRYQPRSIVVGAVISSVTLIISLMWLFAPLGVKLKR